MEKFIKKTPPISSNNIGGSNRINNETVVVNKNKRSHSIKLISIKEDKMTGELMKMIASYESNSERYASEIRRYAEDSRTMSFGISSCKDPEKRKELVGGLVSKVDEALAKIVTYRADIVGYRAECIAAVREADPTHTLGITTCVARESAFTGYMKAISGYENTLINAKRNAQVPKEWHW